MYACINKKEQQYSYQEVWRIIIKEEFKFVKKVNETRSRVSPQEVEIAFDDLYTSEGYVSLEILASWLATTEDAVLQSLPEHLSVDVDGTVTANW